jgi:hypothetical protein
MTSPSETAIDHQMAAEDEAGMPGRTPDPGGPLLTENPQPAAPAGDWQLDAAATGSPTEEPAEEPVEEPEVASLDDAEGPVTRTVPDLEPEPVPEFPAATPAESLSMRWHQVLTMFVDDPRTSAELAAGLVDDNIQALVASLRQQQESLLAAWHDEDAGTEELRTAVRHYRALGNRLADFTMETDPQGRQGNSTMPAK